MQQIVADFVLRTSVELCPRCRRGARPVTHDVFESFGARIPHVTRGGCPWCCSRQGRWCEIDLGDGPTLLPPIPACYVVYGIVSGEARRAPLYVGQTTNLAARFVGHGIRPSSRGPVNLFETAWGALADVAIKYRPSFRYGDWAAIELRLIRRLRPRFNVRVHEQGGGNGR